MSKHNGASMVELGKGQFGTGRQQARCSLYLFQEKEGTPGWRTGKGGKVRTEYGAGHLELWGG